MKKSITKWAAIIAIYVGVIASWFLIWYAPWREWFRIK